MLRPHLLLAAGLLSLGTVALAQPPAPPQGGPGVQGRPGPMHAPMTRDQLKTMLEAQFDKLDANHDGKLASDDRDLLRTQRRNAMFIRLDANKDGVISKDEFETKRWGGPQDAKADGDKPGKRPGMRFAAAHHGPRPMGGMMFGMSREPISKADFVAKGLAHFDKIDTDHDGTISPAERDAARQQMREHRGRTDMPSPPIPPRG